MKNSKHSIVILGGGIAGVEAAIYYSKEGFDVELISEREYLFIYPISIWIPVSTIAFDDVAYPLEKLALKHGFKLTLDKVLEIHSATKTIHFEKSGSRYIENLVIALGASKMKHTGLEHTLSICGAPEQSMMLKDKIEKLIDLGHGRIAFGFGGNPNDPSAVRGGPGFELFFNLHHLLVKKGIRDNYEMTFFAPMPVPGARMGEGALKLMDSLFKRNKFQTQYGKKIQCFEDKKVIFDDDTFLESDLTMFIPAGAGHELIINSDLPQNGAGFIQIDDYCNINGINGWYAIGDSAALEGPDWKAKQGHIAEVMARNAAHNHVIALGMKEDMKKGYQEHLNILCMMDMGNGAGYVYRDSKKAYLIPLPIIGHWMKIGWGWYYKLSKMGRIPRIPGM